MGNKILDLVQSFHRLARSKFISEPWKVTPKVSCFYQMPKQDQELVDRKYQALDESTKEFVCRMFPTLSEDQEKELRIAFRMFTSKDLSSILENKRSRWQCNYEDPDLWGRLNEDQRQAVMNKFLCLPEHLRNLAARYKKEREELLNLIREKKERLMCPVCYELPSGEIFSCSNQHMICSDCLPQLVNNICPTCREALGTRPRRHAFAEAGVRELNLLLEMTNRVTG